MTQYDVSGSRERLYNARVSDVVRTRNAEVDPPSLVVWEITGKCDLACGHCGSRSGTARPDELSTPEALDLVHQLASLGVKEVDLIGGEAYLRSDWNIIASEVVKSGMACCLVTGAFNLNEATVEKAASAGISQISISLDGAESVHDRLRGIPGSWRRAVKNSEHVVAAGITLSVNSQVNRLTMPDLPRLANVIVDIGAVSWMVILTAAMGRAADRPALLLQPYELQYLFPLLASIRKTILDPHSVTVHAASNLGYFTDLSESFRFDAKSGHYWTGCNAGSGVLGIEANGDIKGCPSLPSKHFVGGSIRDRTLADVVQNSPVIKEGSGRSEKELWGFCASCQFASVCKAGCTWTSHVLFGRAGNNPFCHHRVLSLRARGIRERLVRTQSAPRQRFDHGLFEIVEETYDPQIDDDIAGLQNFLSLVAAGVGNDEAMLSDESSKILVKRT